jgi:hypothetical protein
MSSRLILSLALAIVPATATASLSRDVTARAPAIDSVRLQSELKRANEATNSGDAKKARAIYRKLIDEQRRAGEYARLPLWNLALHYYYEDDTRNAALTLDELAKEANRYGDPGTELRAMFESTTLWAKRKELTDGTDRIERIKDLLKSPVIADADKREFRARMG